MSVSDPNVQKVIDCLNKARLMEITAIHQYMIQNYALDEMDYGQLAVYMKTIAIDEMHHSEWFGERVDALGGLPESGMAEGVKQPQTIEQMYPYDIGLETNTIKVYNDFVKICHECKDSITAGLFNKVIKQEEIHLAYYEETKEHLEKLGNAFLAKYAATSKKTGPIKSFVKLMDKEDF